MQIMLPDGTSTLSGQPDCNRLVLQALGREVVLSRPTHSSPRFEQCWPAVEGQDGQPAVSEQAWKWGGSKRHSQHLACQGCRPFAPWKHIVSLLVRRRLDAAERNTQHASTISSSSRVLGAPGRA